MKVLHALVTVASVVLVSAGSVHAVVLNSPQVFISASSNDAFYCSATNVGATNIASITVELISATGSVVGTDTCTNVLPANACQTGFNPSASAKAFCRVTSTSRKVRAEVEIDDSSQNTKVEVPFN
jgi:hypothetical protein